MKTKKKIANTEYSVFVILSFYFSKRIEMLDFQDITNYKNKGKITRKWCFINTVYCILCCIDT